MTTAFTSTPGTKTSRRFHAFRASCLSTERTSHCSTECTRSGSRQKNGPGFRIGFCKIGVARRHKQLVAYLDKHAEDIVCWTLGRPIEFIPITEVEYKYHCHRAETSNWLSEFTLEMISG